jgi:hypothetical protein
MEEEKKVEKAKKRDLKLQALKEKKKGKDNMRLFMHRVADKSDPAQVEAFINEEVMRHVSYSKMKKGT